MHIIEAMQRSGDLVIKVIKGFQLLTYLHQAACVSEFWVD